MSTLPIRTIWSATEILTSRLPDDLAIRTAYVRVFLIGLTLQIVLQRFPRGILPEQRATVERTRPERRLATPDGGSG